MSAEKQPITAEDLYRITLVEDPRISPDGRWIAYVQVTTDKLDNGYKRNIWLVSTEGDSPFQLTRSGSQIRTAKWQIANLMRLQKRYDEALAMQLLIEAEAAEAEDPDGYVIFVAQRIA